jgi:flagellar motor component MotA
MSVHEQVRHYLGQVRRRLMAQSAARGLGACGVVALVATVVAVLGANAWRFSDAAVGIATALLWSAVVAAIGWFLARPLIHPCTAAAGSGKEQEMNHVRKASTLELLKRHNI